MKPQPFRTLVGISMILLTVAATALGQDAAPKQSPPGPAGETPHTGREHSRHTATLGVLVADLHPALAAHLPDHVAPELGVVVEAVTPESPAAHAGLHVHDILLRFDDQKLYSALQLSKLVRNDQPHRKVMLELLRRGMVKSVEVTLGEGATPEAHVSGIGPGRAWNWPPLPLYPFHRPGPWKQFDSMTLKKTGPEHYRATVQYADPQGRIKKHEFEGTNDEIREKIEHQDDLTPGERQDLLEDLGLISGPAPVPLTDLQRSES